MALAIRDVREHDLNAVLALNNIAGRSILALDAARLRYFYEHAEYFRVAEIDGQLAGLLVGGRTALNFVRLMPGIASMTRRYVDAVAGTGARIIDTRKTHPGLRAIVKHAVRVGRGFNHRFGHHDGVLMLENPHATPRSVRKALHGARAHAAPTLKPEVEGGPLAEVD